MQKFIEWSKNVDRKSGAIKGVKVERECRLEMERECKRENQVRNRMKKMARESEVKVQSGMVEWEKKGGV